MLSQLGYMDLSLLELIYLLRFLATTIQDNILCRSHQDRVLKSVRQKIWYTLGNTAITK
jgi:hypothetical protein